MTPRKVIVSGEVIRRYAGGRGTHSRPGFRPRTCRRNRTATWLTTPAPGSRRSATFRPGWDRRPARRQTRPRRRRRRRRWRTTTARRRRRRTRSDSLPVVDDCNVCVCFKRRSVVRRTTVVLILREHVRYGTVPGWDGRGADSRSCVAQAPASPAFLSAVPGSWSVARERRWPCEKRRRDTCAPRQDGRRRN